MHLDLTETKTFYSRRNPFMELHQHILNDPKYVEIPEHIEDVEEMIIYARENGGTLFYPKDPRELICCFPQNGLRKHEIIVGKSGNGKSVFLENEAKRLGITYEELLKRGEPTEEQRAAMKAYEQKQAAERKVKEITIRNAIWSTFVEIDLAELYDVVKFVFETTEPVKSQAKELFFALVMIIVGNIVSWGLCDTSTRESIWEFAKEYKEGLNGN